MFGLFNSPPFLDPDLGELIRRRGLWRGTLAIGPSDSVPLAIAGNRARPDTAALAAAHALPQLLDTLRSDIEVALFEHLEPYAASADAENGEPRAADMPRIDTPSEVWAHVTMLYVAVTALAGKLTTEIGYTSAWDPEHTLGARIQDGRFVELCGSVLSP